MDAARSDAAASAPGSSGAASTLRGRLVDPERPRAHEVPSAERPHGHPLTLKGRTPLQQHLDYFDLDGNGLIMPWETFQALRYLRVVAWEPFNSVAAFWLAVLLHLAFAWRSQGGWLPHPLLPIVICNAAATRHGASSGCYNARGYFVPAAFEAMWAGHYDSAGRGKLSALDVARLCWRAGSWRNPFGSVATAFQWALAWVLFRDDDNNLRKSDVRGIFDGTAFHRLADRVGNPWAGLRCRRDAVAQRSAP